MNINKITMRIVRICIYISLIGILISFMLTDDDMTGNLFAASFVSLNVWVIVLLGLKLSVVFIKRENIKAKKRKEKKRYEVIEKKEEIKKVDVSKMTGIEYERYCGKKLMMTGEVSRIEYTPTSNDYGADIIAYMNDGIKVAIQCKRYSGKVGNSAVQEIVAAKAHYNAQGAMIITNSKLTENAKVLAKENEVGIMELFD